ncbi:MAG: HAMP domain-containing histidine kinase [Ruminococcus sp.]|nr:HAMP domain-containing histidine kinase [Ruminococcus sp.]
MIKRLQRKFVLIVAVSLFIVEVLIIGVINIINIRSVNSENDNLMQMIAENDGKIPDFFKRDDKMHRQPTEPGNIPQKFKNNNFNEETKYQTRFFVVEFDQSGEVSRVDTGHIAAVDSEQAAKLAKQVLDGGKESGTKDNYMYRVTERAGGKTVIFLDVRQGAHNKNRFMLISALVAAAGYVITCLLVLVFSKRAVKPVIESYEKQRRFITDAGHELKTPLAIISANTEVIEMTSEPSEWTQSIKNQVTRLDGLVKQLLQLSKMEEDDVKLVFSDFDMTSAVEQAAQPFEAVAKTNEKSLLLDLQKDIVMHGDENAIKQLTAILADNAVKYADKGSQIKVALSRSQSGRHAVLSVSNECAQPPKDTDKLFDRFYRSDEARTHEGKTGGYGIGLSIALAVTQSHKGKIECRVDGNTVTFTARFRTSKEK